MSRSLLIAAFACIFSIEGANAENQARGSNTLAGFQLGTRLTNRIDVKVPSSDQNQSSAAERDTVMGDEPAKKAPIRKVRVIY